MENKIRICLIGAGFVGKKHAAAYAQQHNAKLQVICDNNESSAKILAEKNGFERIETDWHKAVQAEDVDLVCVCVPNNAHFEIVSEAIKYGKYIACEKPLGINGSESEKLMQLAMENGIIATCCYNIIRIPAIEYAQKIIKSGKLGKIVCFRGSYDNDRLADSEAPFEWRMLKKNSEGGSLCDLAINILAVSQFLIGDIVSVCGMTDIIYAKRKDQKGNYMEVENEDIAQFICSYKNGAMGYISSNRVAPGSKQDMKFEIQFTKGAIRFSLERMNEIQIYQLEENGFLNVISDTNGWFCVGYEELKSLDAKKLLTDINNKTNPETDFCFATKIDYIIESVLESAKKKKWIEIKEIKEFKI